MISVWKISWNTYQQTEIDPKSNNIIDVAHIINFILKIAQSVIQSKRSSWTHTRGCRVLEFWWPWLWTDQYKFCAVKDLIVWKISWNTHQQTEKDPKSNNIIDAAYIISFILKIAQLVIQSKRSSWTHTHGCRDLEFWWPWL